MALEIGEGGSSGNDVVITSSNENSARIIAQVNDLTNISKYGLLQDIYNIDNKDISQARNIAKNKLAELNKIIEDNSVELLGNDDVRSGRILEFNEPITGLIGRYLVKECIHTYNNSIHKMQLQLEVF